MKKIISFLTIILFTFNAVHAENNLSFIYINGSNNNNPKMKSWYEKGVRKLHPILREKFLNNKDIKNAALKNGGISIKEDPVIFFWGYNSKNELEYVKNQLEISKMVSSSGAYIVRNLITQFLHDAIWVQKPHNMLPILDELNNKVIEESQKGNQVILYGYSAGTFVTYEYMFNKLRYINLEELFKTLKTDDDFISFIQKNPQKDTCISALSFGHGGIGELSAFGHLLLNQNNEMLKENYLKLDEATEKFCAPDKVLGVVNFASPLPLFYSDLSNKNYNLNYYNKYMLKYIIENGIFMLTINFKEDPLGFPSNSNMTVSDIEKRINLNIENPKGTIYDNSGVWSKRIFPLAHTSYWTARSTFANAIVKSFINSYKFQYNEEYQQKILNSNKKRYEITH